MEDLSAMGCTGFLGKPWGFRSEAIVRELIEGAPNQFDNSLQSAPPMWTREIWRRVYDLEEGGTAQANQKGDFVRGKFRGAANSKDGFAIEDCVNVQHWRLLEFLVPILHPEKPTQGTSTIGNAIFGALSGEKRMDWAAYIHTLMNVLVSNVGKSRATPVCPYLFHLYKNQSLLTLEENKEWRAQMALRTCGGSDEESETEPDSPEPEDKGENPKKRSWEEEEEEEAVPLNRRRTKRTPSLRGSPSVPRKDKGPEPMEPVVSRRSRSQWRWSSKDLLRRLS